MSVVKSLALGASILGSMVAPTLAGSMRTSHHVPDRPNSSGSSRCPTLARGPGFDLPLGSRWPRAENLANLWRVQPAQTFLSALSRSCRPPSQHREPGDVQR